MLVLNRTGWRIHALEGRPESIFIGKHRFMKESPYVHVAGMF